MSLILLPLSLWAAALAQPGDAPAIPKSVSREEVDRLRALGYVDVSEQAADPARLGVVRHVPGRSYPGYNLFTNAHLCSTQLIDEQGKLLHEWSLRPCFRWDNTVLLPDGDLLVVGRMPAQAGGAYSAQDAGAVGARSEHYLMKMSWDGRIRWRKEIPAHHDAQPTPRGQIAVLSFEPRRIPEIDPQREVRDDSLTLLDMDGEQIDRASLYDLLKARSDLFTFQPVSDELASEEDKQRVAILHSNSVEWMRYPHLASRHPLYSGSNVLVCIRHQDTVAVIDWDKKRLIWAWGHGELSGPHDATVLANGNFLIFDNGLGRGWSRVIELDPIARRIVWQYRAEKPQSFYTRTRGSSQRLPNGNTLIVSSDSGRAFEVDHQGSIVWEFLNPNLVNGKSVAIVRMRRIDTSLVKSLLERTKQ